MYESTGKPSVSKFRCRLAVINKAATSGKILADHWNPKGRHFDVQRKMIRYFEDTAKISGMLLEYLERNPR